MTKTAREDVYAAIDSERVYQDAQWPQGNPLTIGESLLLIEQYTAKACVVWTVESPPETETLNVVRKIAGIAVRCMENHGAPKRPSKSTDRKVGWDGCPENGFLLGDRVLISGYALAVELNGVVGTVRKIEMDKVLMERTYLVHVPSRSFAPGASEWLPEKVLSIHNPCSR